MPHITLILLAKGFLETLVKKVFDNIVNTLVTEGRADAKDLICTELNKRLGIGITACEPIADRVIDLLLKRIRRKIKR